MRGQFTFIFILTLLFAGTYFYREAASVCAVPIEYRIGEIDEGFDISEEEALQAVASAATSWENAAERTLFKYNPDADFTINFVFDERQEYANAEESFREKLDVTEGVNNLIDETYAELVARYGILETEYQNKVIAYEDHLTSYNAQVQEINDAGGATPEVYKELQVEQRLLDTELSALTGLGDTLNALTKEINKVGDRGNQLVEVYNRNVTEYNNSFGEAHEFTQGDYRGDYINIYKFSDIPELELVLAHELGHALSLGHVENETSIMYHLMGAQPSDIHLSAEDVREYRTICESSWIERLSMVLGL